MDNPTIFVLVAARQKLIIYRDNSSGEYLGGMEYTMLIKLIDEEIQRLKVKPTGCKVK